MWYVWGMIIFIGFVIAAVAIGIWIVMRSGVREIELDRKDQELPIPSEEYQMLPRFNKWKSDQTEEESWTAEADEDVPDTTEGE